MEGREASPKIVFCLESLARSTTEVNSAVGERGAAHGGLEKDLSRLDSFE